MAKAKGAEVQTCYMCDRPATSREHAPPKCFFPKEADQPADIRKDLSRNLIAVPSCDEHNSQKSSTDEYVRFVICSTFNGNQYKQSQWERKVLKSFEKQGGKFKKFAPELIPVVLEGPDGKREESVAIYVDQAEFDDALEHIGRAIYYHHFSEKAPEYSVVHTAEFLDISSDNRQKVNEIHKQIQQTVDQGCENEPRHGENPEVFYYQVLIDKENCSVFSMTFYEGMRVTVAFSTEEFRNSKKMVQAKVPERRNAAMAAAVKQGLSELSKK